ncbi:hypothetical protein NW754_009235 [Fusarium falciforme]|nr:hypothetical protein NW754_009235 [Fusarium falciforme]
MLNSALLALFVLYVLGVGFSGLAMLGSLAAFFLFRAAVILVTVAGDKGVDKINDVGDDVGISASLGTKFLALTWASSGLMIAATVYWATHLCLMRRERKRQWTPRKGSY